MPILDRNVLVKHGPYVKFASVPSFIPTDDGQWVKRESYESHIFFSWADSLVDMVCCVTHSYIFFDLYEFTQYDRVYDIYEFASKILFLASQVASCPDFYFTAEISLYEDSTIPECQRTGAHLKADLLETLLYVSSKITETARDCRCLVIVGI
jgi:hypothetical protein